jgi:predicted nuclease with RNAse H fold
MAAGPSHDLRRDAIRSPPIRQSRFAFRTRPALAGRSASAYHGLMSTNSILSRRTRARRPGICVGIDLAGVPHRETGIAILRQGRLSVLATAGDDAEILAYARQAGRWGTVALNAPLTRPMGRCCLDDGCRCRTDPGTRSRQSERDLARMGVPTLATAIIKVLARRGASIAGQLRLIGIEPLEVYPFASLRLLSLPSSGKKTEAGRRQIHRALKPLVPGLRHPRATEHELDAVVCALTASLWRQRRTRTVGHPDEGLMTIPDGTLAGQRRAAFPRPEPRP